MATRRPLKLMSLAALSALIAGQALVFAADITAPSDVENLEAFPGDGRVTLTWDPATDDTAVEGYFLYSGTVSVADHGGSYSFGAMDVGELTTYVMEGLDNDVTYYFAVTAYDAEGNESDFYSYEAEATPVGAGEEDRTAPELEDVTVVTNTLLELQFSEAVVLPEDGADAFEITDEEGVPLPVTDAYLSSEDESLVFVVTVEQYDKAYTLAVTDQLLDKAGNPTANDSLEFTGELEGEEETPEEEMDELAKESSADFQISDIEVISENELVVVFTEEVTAAEADGFTILELDDAMVEVDVLAVNIDPEDATRVSLLTESMTPGTDYELSIDDSLENGTGLALDPESDALEFTGKTLDLSDLIAPEDVTNLLATVSGETGVKLSWTASLDLDGDLAKYMVYKAASGDDYGSGIAVAKDLVTYTFSGLNPGESYDFLVTAVDENGNESEGVMKTLTLPESGPGMVLMGGMSMLGAGVLSRRKKRF